MGTITRNFANSITSTTTARSGLNFKNCIINGNMQVDQRNSGSAVTNTGATTFYLDRWNVLGTTSAGQFSNQGVFDAPNGIGVSKSYKIVVTTADSSLASGDRYILMHRIEGYNLRPFQLGTANAQQLTISFYVKSSVTGTFAGALLNGDADRRYIFEYTISSADTWERKTITLTGDTSGTWATGSSRGAQLTWSLGAGSDYQSTKDAWGAGGQYTTSSATNLMATGSATFQLTGVQMELGPVATDVEVIPYDIEFQRCCRYYFKLASGANQTMGRGGYYSSSQGEFVVDVPVIMRSNPTLDYVSGTDYYVYYRNGGSDTINTLALNSESQVNQIHILNNAQSSGTAGHSLHAVTNNASSYVALNAEM